PPAPPSPTDDVETADPPAPAAPAPTPAAGVDTEPASRPPPDAGVRARALHPIASNKATLTGFHRRCSTPPIQPNVGMLRIATSTAAATSRGANRYTARRHGGRDVNSAREIAARAVCMGVIN